MLSESPYCPFRADIWQLGKMFKSIFGVYPLLLLSVCLLTQPFHQHLSSLSPSLIELFDVMCSDDPLSRPLASELLERIRRWDISQETLMAKVPE
jgi:hypothetical protein